MFRLGGSVGPVSVSTRVSELEFVKLVGFILALGAVAAVVMNLWLIGAIMVVVGCVLLLLGRIAEAGAILLLGVVTWVWVGPAVHDYFKYGREVPELFDMHGTSAEEARASLRDLGFTNVIEEVKDFGLSRCIVIGTEPKAGENADIREPITLILSSC